MLAIAAHRRTELICLKALFICETISVLTIAAAKWVNSEDSECFACQQRAYAPAQHQRDFLSSNCEALRIAAEEEVERKLIVF